MRWVLHNFYVLRLVCFGLLLPATTVYAESSEIIITADQVDFREIEGISIYSGNARLEQNESYITGETITVKHKNNEIIDVFIKRGADEPVYFNHVPTDDRPAVEGWADNAHYDVAKEILVLTGDAEVKQNINLISAETLIFERKKNRVRARASKEGRVTTVFEIGK